MSLLRSVSRSSALLRTRSTQRFLSSTSLPSFAAAATPNSSAGPAGPAGPWADRPSSSRLNRYIVIAEDFADAGANARRFEVRERHLEQAQNGKRVGRIEMGGALLRRDFADIDQELGPGPHMAGSVLVLLAESIEDVRTRVLQDEYAQGHVWDVERVKIYPFLQAPLVNVEAAEATAASEAAAGASASGNANANATLGQLRQDLAAGKGPKMVTLGALRRMHQSAKPLQ